jgi:hypothetical protein
LTVLRPLVVRLFIGLVFFASGLATANPARAQLPSDARWSTFDTQRFRVHFHEPALEPAARRAAGYAEAAYDALAEAFVDPPSGRIDLVLADNVDFANGYAATFPTNRVVVYVHPPTDSPSLSFFDDWLNLVVTHELVHIFHLDQAGGVWTPLRRVFGRTVDLFPQHLTPGWVIEGLAVYFESRLTGAGRVQGTHHDMILRAASLEDAFFPIDRATGAPISWPGGSGRYVYGSLFVAHLAERYGEAAVGRFVRDVGERIVPFRMDAAARSSFGVSFTDAWREWQDSLRVRYTTLADSLRAAGVTEPEILTPDGRFAQHPRVARDGGIAYASATLRDEPSTRLITASGDVAVVAGRTTLGPLSWFGDAEALLTAELELRGPYRIVSDLVRVDRAGRRTRLTDGARLREPDLHPDGRRAVAVGHAPATNVLALVELETGASRPLVAPSERVHWAAPRWSPDGTRIAAARWRRGGWFDIVVVDTAGRVVREVTAERGIATDPAWSPDGRYLLFSSDRTGIANLFAYDLERGALHQVTNVLTGAFQPDVSPDGRWIVFSHYSAAGYHIARIPFDPAAWRAAPAPRRGAAVAEGTEPGVQGNGEYLAAPAAGGPVRRYSPLPSVLPAGWLPLLDHGTRLGTGIGGSVFGRDLVGRHAWSADALVFPDGMRIGATLNYQYRGLGQPVVEVDAAQQWSVLGEGLRAVTTAGDTLRSDLFRREQRAMLLLRHSWPRWRSQRWVGGGPDLRQTRESWENPVFRERLPRPDWPLDLGLRLFGGYSSVRGYGYSISPEEGVLLQLSGEARRFTRPLAGEEAARGYQRLIGQAVGFQPLDFGGFARHVAGTRLAAGAETGAFGPGFSIGGVSGTAVAIVPGVTVEGTWRTFGLRGYPVGAQRGDRALATTAEYRFPLLLVERGLRTWPVFLDRVWGTAFVDAGAAWCAANCTPRFVAAPRSPTPLASTGAELAASSLLGYDLRLLLRGGVAVPLRAAPATGTRPAPQFYLVGGRSF